MKSKRKLGGVAGLLVAAGLAIGAVSAQAQTGVIQGQVLDGASRRPLANAQVLVEGTGNGQLTNSSGRFVLLNVPSGDHVVRVTLIGYEGTGQTVTVTAGRTVTADIELSSTAIALNEIVVTGVGTETTRRALGTSVEVLSAEDFELAPVQSIDQVLQGRVAGATISSTSAQPGTGSLINFRGVSSVFNAQTPVIYVDGVRVDNDHATTFGTGGEQSSALADLLISDIERIEVTKGGAASTLYGSDAATGVIQIFTKKGTPGAPRITARVEQGIERPELWNILDTRLIFPDRVESGEVAGTFMEDLYFQQGRVQSYYVGVSGGTADVTYSVGARLEDRTGTQPKDGSTYYNLRGGMQASLSDDFTLEFSGELRPPQLPASLQRRRHQRPADHLRGRRRALLFGSRRPARGATHLSHARYRRGRHPGHLLRRGSAGAFGTTSPPGSMWAWTTGPTGCVCCSRSDSPSTTPPAKSPAATGPSSRRRWTEAPPMRGRAPAARSAPR